MRETGNGTWGGFSVNKLEALPAGACLRSERRVIWLDTECGHWAQLDGAAQLYNVPSGEIIAAVTDQAALALFDGETIIELQAGIWKIMPPE